MPSRPATCLRASTAGSSRITVPLLQSELSPPADQAYSRGMEDMLAHLETLQVQIAECEMIRDLATDPVKRALFTKLAEHYKVLAAEVQRAINEQQARGSE
jgi:hypothetical protein